LNLFINQLIINLSIDPLTMIPGFGTYQLKKETQQMVEEAINMGCRAIDTATLYRNEHLVGRGIRSAIEKGVIERKDLYLTTKIPPWHIKEKTIYQSLLDSIKTLDCEWIDMVLIHKPIDGMIESSWKELEDAIERINRNGEIIRGIGVSNYKVEHLERVFECCDIKPDTNQIELSPFHQQQSLVDYCRDNNLKIVAHSSLTKGEKFNHPVIEKISKDLQKSPAQILLRWGVDNQYYQIPRTSSTEHLSENMDINFQLTQEMKDMLNGLDEKFATHPQYL
jgi:methylglyoxal/glyoxal reductase